MEWLNDPKNRPFVIGGFAVIVIVVFLLIGKQTGLIGGRGGGGGVIPPTGTATQPGAGGATMPVGAGGPSAPEPGTSIPGAPAPGLQPPGAPSTPTAGAEVAAAGGVAPQEYKRYYPPQPVRADPFTPLAAARIQRVELPKIIIRTVPEAPPKEAESFETVPMRMAGILWNGGLMAILEDEASGKSTVVRPGDVVSREGGNVKVLSIKRSSVTVQVGKRTEEVFMKPAPPTTVAGAPTGGGPTPPRGPGMPGGPGVPPPVTGGGGGGAFGAQ
jgi:hypothetical protein